MGRFSRSRRQRAAAQFIVLTYKGDPSSKELLALVGKGITFDTGGISLKPPERMEEMKYDMSGGAGVIAAMGAIAKLKPKINVVGIVPAHREHARWQSHQTRRHRQSDERQDHRNHQHRRRRAPHSCRRLCYAKKLGATKIVDTATLTGACVIALGHAATAASATTTRFTRVSGRRQGHRRALLAHAALRRLRQANEERHRRPQEHRRPPGRNAHRGRLLTSFVDDATPWIHLDIAGTAYLDPESAWQAKGPTGTPVRALLALTEAESPAKHPNGVAAAK